MILSEYESKKIISSYGIPTTKEELVFFKEEAIEVSKKIGFPIVLKACSSNISHKSDLNLVYINLRDEKEVAEAYDNIKRDAKMPIDGILVQEMIIGNRELAIGLIQNPQFGPCVMFGIGGIYTEILNDVAFRVAPLEKRDALEMINEIKASSILGEFRGQKPVDKEILCQELIGVGRMGIEIEEIKEIDINPLIVAGNKPIAVDAFIVLR